MTSAKPTPEPAIQRMLSALTLDSLRGFEAAARLGSFTAAADELCLTQSAISKQVKALEDVLGCAVFIRGSRTLQLTPAGETLFRDVNAWLTQLARTLAALTTPARTTVSITMPPALASLWLTPRLSAFRDDAPDIDLHIDASPEHLSLDRQGFDLALRMVESPSEALLTEHLTLVAAPAVASQIHQASDLLRWPLLGFEHPVRRYQGMDWSHWYTLLGLTMPAEQAQHRFSQYEALLKAVVDGLGVGIGRHPLVDQLMAEGRLIRVLPQHSMPGLSYQLIRARSGHSKAEARRFAQWLGQQASRQTG